MVGLGAMEVNVAGAEQQERKAPGTKVQRQLSLCFPL